MTLVDSIRNHSVSIFFSLAFGISWLLTLAAVGPEGIFDADTVYIAGPISLAGPSIAGILMTALVQGKEGFRNLVSRAIRWKVGTVWYAVALLTAPMLIMVILLLLSITSRDFLPTVFGADDRIGLVLSGIFAGSVVAPFEELGWTGFAMPEMRKRYGVNVTGLIMGVAWGAWHLPLFLGSTSSSGAVPSLLFISVLLFSFLVPYRILMVRMYDRTRSLLLVILMHLPLAASQFILIPSSISGGALLTFDLLFAAVLWVIVAAAAISACRVNDPRSHRCDGSRSEMSPAAHGSTEAMR
ncbi:MAG: CPBP family intramembrane glutamic endopeptidase [Thermoplasmatota archaeon]